jgi:D-alanyl-D-alanine carboxypeptidase/D-alanyl-D-alanine-endopeptidase (penicillin-binding protein 4)
MTSRNELYLDGCLKEYKEVRISLPINNPSLKTLNTVKRYLKKLDITYTGTVIIGKLPNGVKAITYISSETLFPLLKHMLLHSDNLYAESIARSVGYKLNGSGNITSSTQAIKNIISKKLDINTKFLILKDGSGLSSLDKTSPQLLVNLLTKTFNMPRIGNELYNSLPQSGISGTLSYRMNKQLQGKVRAKTGTLKGTVTLSGYVITKRKNQLTFSIMINKLKKSQRNSARAFQNNVVKLFYDNY